MEANGSAQPANGSGRVALVTGGTDGIGRAVALELARGGDRVLFVGRSRERGAAVLAALRAIEPDAEHVFLQADLSLLSETARLAEMLASHTQRLDAMVFCAGILSTVPEWTTEGLERNFVLNYLTRYLLARRLLPLLAQAPSGRLVLVANAGLWRQPEFRRPSAPQRQTRPQGRGADPVRQRLVGCRAGRTTARHARGGDMRVSRGGPHRRISQCPGSTFNRAGDRADAATPYGHFARSIRANTSIPGAERTGARHRRKVLRTKDQRTAGSGARATAGAPQSTVGCQRRSGETLRFGLRLPNWRSPCPYCSRESGAAHWNSIACDRGKTPRADMLLPCAPGRARSR